GRLAIVAFHPSVPKLMEYASRETLQTEADFQGGRVKIFDRAEDDRIEQIRHMSRRVEMLDSTGRKVSEHHYTFDIRYVFKAAMLARARTRAEAIGRHPQLTLGDMRDFTLPRRYARAIVTFNTFAHCDTTEDQLRALRCIREHLEEDGAVVVFMSFPGPSYWS